MSDWTGGYRPAIAAPPDFLGLYFEAKRQRQQQDQFRASQEADAQAQRLKALNDSMELGFKSGDYNLAVAMYDAVTPLGRESDYKAIRSSAKAGKQRLATPTAKGQSEMAAGLAGEIQSAPDALQGAMRNFRGQEAMRAQGVPEEAANQIGMRAQAQVAGNEAEFKDFTRRADYTAGGQWQSYYNPETGKFVPRRKVDREGGDKLVSEGWMPVNQFAMGGTPKDFAAGLTPTSATRIQNQVQQLAESGDRLRLLGEKFNPDFFKYETAAEVWALDKLSKSGIPLSDAQETLLGDYQDFMAVAGEETLAFTVSMAASTFTDRLRDHIQTLRFSPGMNQVTFQKRLERLTTVGQQATARLNFALKNGIVKATDYDPAGNLTPDAKDRLEKAIPMAIPGYSMPPSNKRIDKLMENRFDDLLKQAALERIPQAQRSEWAKQRFDEEFFKAPPIGTDLQDPVEMDLLEGLKGAGVELPGDEGVPGLTMRRVQ